MYSKVTHIFSARDRAAIAEHVEKHAGKDISPFWTPGWPNEIEAALLDAVYSGRAPYGGPDNGVRGAVSRWRAHRDAARLDDLRALASFADRSDELAAILGNRQRVSGNSITKAEAVARVARALGELGVRTAADLLDSDEQCAAVTAVIGIGTKTWECILFLVGRRTLDSSVHFIAFASDGVGRRLDGEVAETLLAITAESMDADPVALEHAVWRYQRKIGVAAVPAPLTETA